MATTNDRVNHLVVAGTPAVTGLVAVGDAWAMTTPLLGQGATIGLLHAGLLRTALHESGAADSEKLVCGFDALTQQHIEPLRRSAVWFSGHRRAEMIADAAGIPYRTPAEYWLTDKAFQAAALQDPTCSGGVWATAP